MLIQVQVQDLWGNILITGSAGFMGSHLADALVTRGLKVTVLDNFSTGKLENLGSLGKGHSANIVKEDLKNPQKLEGLVESSQTIFHLAANPEVQIGEVDPGIHFRDARAHSSREAFELATKASLEERGLQQSNGEKPQ